MLVGQSQMSSISTLIEASSSAPVFARLFHCACLAVGTDQGSDPALRNPKMNKDSARPSNINSLLTTLFNPGIFLRSASRARRRGACPWYPRGRIAPFSLTQTEQPCPTRQWHAAQPWSHPAIPARQVMKRDLYAEVSARIVAELEVGPAPWVKPWSATPGANTPCNVARTGPTAMSAVRSLTGANRTSRG
jgi:hypothetical protein